MTTKSIGPGERISFPLEDERERTFSNTTGKRFDVSVETHSGSIIRFTVPPNGKFRVKAHTDIADVTITIVDLDPSGPRPIGD